MSKKYDDYIKFKDELKTFKNIYNKTRYEFVIEIVEHEDANYKKGLNIFIMDSKECYIIKTDLIINYIKNVIKNNCSSIINEALLDLKKDVENDRLEIQSEAREILKKVEDE